MTTSGLRPYQIQAIEEVRDCFLRGHKKVLLKLATGGGKTVIFCRIIQQTMLRGNNVAMITRGRELVEQASQRLFRENVNHGVMMSNHWNKNSLAKVQVCSVDTIVSRGDYPLAHLLVIDEAHLFTSPSSIEVVNHYADRGAYILAVTATPYTKEPLTHLADKMVNPIKMKNLITQNYLVPPRVFIPKPPDLTGVRTTRGDFNNQELGEKMSPLVGNLVEHWRKFAENRPSLGFAVNIKHSQQCVEEFRNAGIPAEHIEGKHSFAERDAAIERLRTGVTKVLFNVGIFCTGKDIPFLGCVIGARPTKSYNLFIQQQGRGTRPYPGKEDFIYLDHAGNTLRHGFITDEPEVHLEGIPKTERKLKVRICPDCFIAIEGVKCPSCGKILVHTSDRGDIEIEIDHDGALEEVRDLPESIEITLHKKYLDEMRKRKGYKWQWVYYKLAERYGEEVAKRFYPRFNRSTHRYGEPDPSLARLLTRDL